MNAERTLTIMTALDREMPPSAIDQQLHELAERAAPMDQVDARELDLQEINTLAHDLGYIVDDDYTIYDALLGAYFPTARSARDLNDSDRRQWLSMLRLWKVGRNSSAQTSTPNEEHQA
jgi:hypothetical protein